jgi:hypothetical protein
MIIESNRYRKLIEREVERIVKYLVEEESVLKLLRILERQENNNYYKLNDGDNGSSYYSRKYKTWVLYNHNFQLN